MQKDKLVLLQERTLNQRQRKMQWINAKKLDFINKMMEQKRGCLWSKIYHRPQKRKNVWSRCRGEQERWSWKRKKKNENPNRREFKVRIGRIFISDQETLFEKEEQIEEVGIRTITKTRFQLKENPDLEPLFQD